MGGGASGDDEELITQINVTPLVDVVLVLLIILMVTASYIVSHSIPMELPSATPDNNQSQPPSTLAVSVDQSGALYIDAVPVSEADFPGRVREYVASLANPAEARATIAADGRISHSRFIRVVDMLRTNRVTRYAINVSPEDLRQQ